MKITIFILIASLPFKGLAQHKIKIAGNINDKKVKNIIIEGLEFKDTISISNNLTFIDSISLPYNGNFQLLYKDIKFPLYFNKLSNLNIEIKDSIILFSGLTASENNYLFELKKFNTRSKFNKTKGLEDFIKKNEKIQNAHSNNNEFVLNNYVGLDSTFVKLEKRRLHFRKKLSEKFKSNLDETLVGSRITKNVFELIEEKDSLFGFELEEDFLFSDNFKVYHNKILKDSIDQKNIKNEKFIGKLYIDRIKKFKSNYIKNHSLKLVHKYFNADNKYLDTLYNEYINICTNINQKKSITNKYKKLKAVIPGSKAQDFEFENYLGGKTKLSNFKGKYVYISFWTSWCKNCLYSLDSMNEMINKYKDSNIEFITISVDKKSEYLDWRRVVKENKLKSINLFASNDTKSEFIKNFDFTKLEQYILIDPEGYIKFADAPNISSNEFVDLIDSFIKK